MSITEFLRDIYNMGDSINFMITVAERINLLKTDLVQQRLTYEEIFQKHVIDSKAYFFESYIKNAYKEYELKSIISDYLDVHLNDVMIVGSAKLGFSLNPKTLFKEFDYKYKIT